MTTTIVNGYKVTGNHATVGREYHVSNAAGAVLHAAEGIEPAIAFANAQPPGDVPEFAPPKPEPAAKPKPPPELIEVPAPKAPAAKPATRKKAMRKGVK